MKGTFFSILTIAASAIASPVLQGEKSARSVEQVGGAVKNAENIVSEAGVAQILNEVSKGAAKRDLDVDEILAKVHGDIVKRDAVSSPAQLISVLQSGTSNINKKTTGLNSIAEQVEAGDLTKDEAADKSVPTFESVNFELTQIVTKLTGAAGLDVADGDVDKVLSLVVVLVSEVLAAVKTIVTVTGLRPQLISVLHSVFQILTKVLTLVIGLVTAIVPGLIAALTPLLAGLGNGALAPVLTPVVGLLASLGAGI
ncbi:hypothetical protein ACHAPU_001881 [Fusarium lateritium]